MDGIIIGIFSTVKVEVGNGKRHFLSLVKGSMERPLNS
jgi:hypothetical protein